VKIKIEKNPYLVIGLIIFFILLLDYFILLRPQLMLFKQTNRQTGTLFRNLKTAKQDIASLDQFQKRLGILTEKNSVVGERIAQEEEMPVVLENIQLKPSRTEQKIVATAQAGKIYELPILIEARSGYHQLGSFINKLENDQIFMNLASLELLSNDEDASHHNAKMVVEIYILKKE